MDTQVFHWSINLSIATDPFCPAVRDGNLDEMRKLFQDWTSLTTKPGSYFEVQVTDLFKNQIEKEKKPIVEVMSGGAKFNQFTFYGFKEQNWETNKGTNPKHNRNDFCSYTQNGTQMAERYYGIFAVRLESLESRIIMTVNGTQKECDVVGLTKRRQSRNTLNDWMYIDFDHAYIWQPAIETEVKVWKLNKRNYPKFDIYVDPKCLNLPYDQIRNLNFALTDHLHHRKSLLKLISGIMKDHFLDWLGNPYGKFKVSKASG